MEKVEIDEAPNLPNPLGVHDVRRPLSDVLGTEDIAIVYYELGPGEQFSGGLHTHHDQEEVFFVQEGTATFDVGTDGNTVDVKAGEIVRFPPGQFQCGRNETDEQVRGLALGAPGSRHNWEDIESLAPCAECGEVTSHGVEGPTEDDNLTVYCNDCGTELI